MKNRIIIFIMIWLNTNIIVIAKNKKRGFTEAVEECYLNIQNDCKFNIQYDISNSNLSGDLEAEDTIQLSLPCESMVIDLNNAENEKVNYKEKKQLSPNDIPVLNIDCKKLKLEKKEN